MDLGEQDRKYLLEQLVTVKRENLALGAEVDVIENEVIELRDRKDALIFRPMPVLRSSNHKQPGLLSEGENGNGGGGTTVTFSGTTTPGLPELQGVQLSYEISRLKSLTSIDRVKVCLYTFTRPKLNII